MHGVQHVTNSFVTVLVVDLLVIPVQFPTYSAYVCTMNHQNLPLVCQFDHLAQIGQSWVPKYPIDVIVLQT